MTGPGSAGASRMRIAGIVLLAVAGVAAVVGLLALGGQGPPTETTAAPATTPVAPLPGAGGIGPSPSPASPGLPPDQAGLPGGAPGSVPGGAPAPGAGGPGAPGSPVAGAPIVVPDGGPGGAPGGAPGGVPGGSGGAGGGAGGGGVPGADGGGGSSGVSVVPVRVFNNSTIAGLADRAAAEMRARGWNVVQVGNYPQGIIPASTAYYRPGTPEQAAADSAARQFGIRSEPRFEGIRDASPGMIVIATSNWGQNVG